MTTIAYRAGVMAADSGNWFSNVRYSSAIKVARGPDGSLHGICGHAPEGEGYLKWVFDGMVGEAPRPSPVDAKEGTSAFHALVVEPDSSVKLWTAYGWEYHHDVPFFAVGAGAEMAIGAMAAGATAEEAVTIVAAHSNFAVLPVRAISIERQVPLTKCHGSA